MNSQTCEDSVDPLLDFAASAFRRDSPETSRPRRRLICARATAEEVATDWRDATWATVVAPLDDALDRIERAWGAVHHLNAVVSTPPLRDAYHANLPKITAFYTDQAQDERLYARYKALAASPAFAAEDAARRKLVDNELRVSAGGADLPGQAD
jgi:oligopeptidase A